VHGSCCLESFWHSAFVSIRWVPIQVKGSAVLTKLSCLHTNTVAIHKLHAQNRKPNHMHVYTCIFCCIAFASVTFNFFYCYFRFTERSSQRYLMMQEWSDLNETNSATFDQQFSLQFKNKIGCIWLIYIVELCLYVYIWTIQSLTFFKYILTAGC